jgi:hypothetical protein
VWVLHNHCIAFAMLVETQFVELVSGGGHMFCRWAAKELLMYLDGNLDRFRALNKLMIAADPSSYAGEKTMVGIIWSWEAKAAFFGPVQIIPSSTLMSPADMGDMSDRLKAMAMARKLERTSAYREWQALSHLLLQGTGRCLQDFHISPSVSWRPVGPNEVRVVDESGELLDIARIVNRATKQSRIALPDDEDPGSWPQLTVSLDSGAVGRVAASFAKHKLGQTPNCANIAWIPDLHSRFHCCCC